jgi:hypothetical protein
MYAIFGFIAGAVPGATAAIVQGSERSELVVLVIGVAAGLTGLAGLGIGLARPVSRDLSLPASARRCPGILSNLAVGLIVGVLFAYLALMVWFSIAIALGEPSGNLMSPAYRGPRWHAVQDTPEIAIAGAAFTSFLSSLFGALLGGAIRTDRHTSPIIWVAAWAGVLGLLIGSNTGTLTGTLLPYDIAMIVTLSSSVPAGIAAALIVWILVKRRLTAPKR